MRSNDQIIAEFRRNAGRVGGELDGLPIVLIHHVGARSGTTYVTPLAYQPLLGGVVIVGSNGGSPVDPGWCQNLRVHPLIDIEVGTETLTVWAHELEDSARTEIWPLLVAGDPALGEYQATSTRRFPVFLLTPETEAVPK
jgi:deazaflavin-dependent oxidoreductase (nitroreductase family)